MSFRQDCRMVRIYKKGTRVHEMWAGARARPIFWAAYGASSHGRLTAFSSCQAEKFVFGTGYAAGT
jgi:hypothetical protein